MLRAQGHGAREIARRIGRDPRRSRVSCGATRRRAAAKPVYRASVAQWKAELAAKRPKIAKLVNDRGCVSTSRSGSPASSSARTAPSLAGPQTAWKGRNKPTAGRSAMGDGVEPGADRATGCRSTSPMMSPCASATRRSTSRCSSRAVARSSVSWSRACAPAGRCEFRGHGPRTSRRATSPRRGHQRATRRGRRPRRPRALGRRPDHRYWPVRDRHRSSSARSRSTTAGAPAPRWRARATSRTVKNGPIARRLRRHRDERTRSRASMTHAARTATQDPDLGPRQGTLRSRAVHARDRHRGVLRRPALALAASRRTRTPTALLRQYFPKGTDLSRWSAEDLEAVALAVNNRPRKILGWKTPAEVSRRAATLASSRCCIDRLSPRSTFPPNSRPSLRLWESAARSDELAAATITPGRNHSMAP